MECCSNITNSSCVSGTGTAWYWNLLICFGLICVMIHLMLKQRSPATEDVLRVRSGDHDCFNFVSSFSACCWLRGCSLATSLFATVEGTHGQSSWKGHEGSAYVLGSIHPAWGRFCSHDGNGAGRDEGAQKIGEDTFKDKTQYTGVKAMFLCWSYPCRLYSCTFSLSECERHCPSRWTGCCLPETQCGNQSATFNAFVLLW